MSSVRTSAATGVFWMAVQVWLVRATTAGAFIILSRQLQPSEFGLVSLAMAVITVLSLLSDSGLATYVVRAPELGERMLSTAFWTTMIIAGVLAGLLALLAAPVSALFDEPDLAPVLRWLSIGVVLTGLNSVPSALLKREMRFKQLAARGTIATFIGSAVAIVLALNGAGAWALVAQSLVRGLVSVIIIWTAVSWMPRLQWNGRQAKEMLDFGSKLLGIDLLVQARDRGQDFILAASGGTVSLGLWAVANRLLRIVQETGSSVISSVATPAFAKLQGDRPRLYRAYEAGVATSGALMFPIMLFLAVTSPELIPLLLGEQWAVTASLAQIMALTAVVTTFSYFDRPVFVALDKLKAELVLVASSVALQLAVVVVVAPFGLVPLAVALLIRGLVVVPARFITLHRVTGMPFGAMVRPLRVLLAAAIMAAAVWGTGYAASGASPWVRVLLSGLTAAVVYPPVLWLTARPVVRDLLADVQRVRGRAPVKVSTVPPTAEAVVELPRTAEVPATVETSRSGG